MLGVWKAAGLASWLRAPARLANHVDHTHPYNTERKVPNDYDDYNRSRSRDYALAGDCPRDAGHGHSAGAADEPGADRQQPPCAGPTPEQELDDRGRSSGARVLDDRRDQVRRPVINALYSV